MAEEMPSPPPPKPRGTKTDAIKHRYIAAIRDVAGGPEGGSGCVTAIVLVILAALSLTIVLLPLAWKLWKNWRDSNRLWSRLTETLAFAERGEPVMAYPLMVNSMLRRPGDKPAPGLVLVSFENAGDSLNYMADVVLTIEKGTRGELSPADSQFCQRLMEDEEYVPFRRRPIPSSITGGAAVYACDLGIHPHLLCGRHLSDELPLIACMAEPGDGGMILQLPYWHITGSAPPDDAAKQAFIVTLASLPDLRQMARAGR